MSYIGKELFNCNHEILKKVKYQFKEVYKCSRCDKQFIMIPAKRDPIFKFNSPPPSPPDFRRINDITRLH